MAYKINSQTNNELEAMTPEQLADYISTTCRQQYNAISAVLPPVCCVKCKRCPIGSLVTNLARIDN